MDSEIENADSNNGEGADQQVAEEGAEEVALTKEQIAELQAKAAKADDLEAKNKQLFARAKKAEETKVPSNDSDSLSTKDVLYLAKADIHADDVDEVLTYAKKMGVSVSEAHAHFKPILAERADERKTANATHTKGGARGGSKVTGEDLLRKAEETGEVPESAEGMNALFEARQKRRLSN